MRFGLHNSNNLLGRNQDHPLQLEYSDEELVSHFNNFFITKITEIHDALVANQDPNLQLEYLNKLANPPGPSSYRILMGKEVCDITKCSSSKSCEADPIPTTLLKEIPPTFSSALAITVNLSMQTGIFPDSLKEAWVKPLLEKIMLDLIDKNYHPISNLQFQGKIIKKAVTNQLTEHIMSNSLMEPMQSAYYMGHNTESALIKVKSDILSALDKQEVVCLVLLNLSAAFGKVNHTILLKCLEERKLWSYRYGLSMDKIIFNWSDSKSGCGQC